MVIKLWNKTPKSFSGGVDTGAGSHAFQFHKASAINTSFVPYVQLLLFSFHGFGNEIFYARFRLIELLLTRVNSRYG